MMKNKIENIKILLEINGGSKSYEKSIFTIIDAIKHLVPNYKDENLKSENITDIINDIQDQIIPIYDKYFTNDEILGIIEFYKTPIGEMYLNKMGAVAIESMQIGNRYGEIIYKRLMEMNGNKIPEEE